MYSSVPQKHNYTLNCAAKAKLYTQAYCENITMHLSLPRKYNYTLECGTKVLNMHSNMLRNYNCNIQDCRESRPKCLNMVRKYSCRRKCAAKMQLYIQYNKKALLYIQVCYENITVHSSAPRKHNYTLRCISESIILNLGALRIQYSSVA